MSITFYNSKDPYISGLPAPVHSNIINPEIPPEESQPLLKDSPRFVQVVYDPNLTG